MNKFIEKLRWFIGIGLLVAAFGVGFIGLANGNLDANQEYKIDVKQQSEVVAFANNNTAKYQVDSEYKDECGSCHLAYPANFFPARSWRVIMDSLDNHFGENAELDEASYKRIMVFLTANSADVKGGRREARILKYISANDTPLRITELKYVKHKHHEIPSRLVAGNPQVGSLGKCEACHGDKAINGVFNEHTVDIPGHGPWDD